MRSLTLWEAYTRAEVHDIFDPDSPFTPQTGTWGLQGIVRLPTSARDFVFFVTFGSSQGTHDFDEEITEDGVLTWQSQPKQRFDTPMIQEFIAHNDLTHTIHLFLRTKRNIPYTYFGELGYLDHDPNREAPVYFTWQLMSWPPPDEVTLGLNLVPSQPVESAPAIHHVRGQLTKTARPDIEPPAKGSRRNDSARKQALLSGQDARNRSLGLAGEHLVLRSEIIQLREAGRGDLADRVVHVSIIEGDSAGFDIRSFCVDGSARHIEVKTTSGPATNAFFLSPNEIKFSEEHPESYVLVRVYTYSHELDSAYCYEISGALRQFFEMTPSEFRARLLPTTQRA